MTNLERKKNLLFRFVCIYCFRSAQAENILFYHSYTQIAKQNKPIIHIYKF